MNKVRYILALLVAAAITACSNEPLGNNQNAGATDVPVYLSANITNGDVTSRASYDNPYNTPKENYPFTAIIFASTRKGSYDWNGTDMDASTDGTISYCDKSVTFTSGEPVLLAESIKWPSGDADFPVYFTGIYPANTSLWATSSNSASCIIDGKTDVITSAENYGTFANHAAKAEAQLTFNHHLCKLRFRICSESEKVTDAWGRLLKIELINQKTKCTTTLSDGTATFGWATADTDPEAEDNVLPLYQTGKDSRFELQYTYGNTTKTYSEYNLLTEDEKAAYTPNISEMANMPTSATEVAYVLCPPIEIGQTTDTDGSIIPDNYYTLNVYTDGGVVSFLKLNLKDTSDNTFYGNTAGKEFLITLDFVVGNKIYSSSAQITPWKNGGQTDIEIDE